jgi:large subunit ribosomal protein L31
MLPGGPEGCPSRLDATDPVRPATRYPGHLDEEIKMKTATHPDYVTASVRCSCGNTFTTRSVKPELRVELCNECHPFFTGKQKLVDTGGRVERFERRYGARKGQAKK